MSLYYKNTKANAPRLSPYNDALTTNPYGSSLSALDIAWKSVVAAKQELSSVDTRLRKAASPEDKKKIHPSFPPPPKQKSKDNQNIEKRIIYKYADGNYHKENIPPKSFPVPSNKYADFLLYEGDTPENIVPTRRKLYKEENNASHQKDIHDGADNDPFEEDYHKNSSLAGRSLLKMGRSSYALNRLKEKILQQKLNSSLSSTQTNETPFPEKIFHKEDDVVNKNKSEGIQHEQMKRKIAVAPSAPSYKGFNQAETTYSKTNDTHNIRKNRQLDHGKTAREKLLVEKKKPVKNKAIKTGKVKAQRIIAPKKPPTKISTSSWRIGQDIQRKIKQELKAANKAPDGSKKNKQAISTSNEVASHDRSSTTKSALSSEADTPVTTKAQQEDSDTKSDIAASDEKQNTDQQDDSDGSLQEQFLDNQLVSERHEVKRKAEHNHFSNEQTTGYIQENRKLSKAAKNVLQEISLSPTDHDEETSKKVIVAVVDTGLTKSKKIKLMKKSPPVKRKIEEELNTKRKIRHYDQEDIQRYMAKQQAERKRQRSEQKKSEQIQKEIQEKKLKELFYKQKAAVKDSLELKKSHSHGGTFIKQQKSVKHLKDALIRIQEATDEPKKLHFPAPTSSSSPTRLHRLDISNGDEIFKDSLDEDYSLPIQNVVITGNKVFDEGQTNPYSQNNYSRISPVSPLSSPHENPTITDSKRTKADRVEAIRATAAALRHRLDMEAQRLSHLLHTKQQKNSLSSADPSIIMEVQNNEQHLGCLPGVHNIDEQASFNLKLKKMDDAAKRIQALYRGHTVRKSKSWELPSGRSLYQTLEEARHRSTVLDITGKAAVHLASANYPSVLESKSQPKSDQGLIDKSSFQPVKAATQKADSSVSLNDTSSKISLPQRNGRDANKPQSSLNTAGDVSFPSYSSKSGGSYGNSSKHYEDRNERLREILKKHGNEKGERYSVINIFARNYPGLRRQQLSEEISDTEKIIADAYDYDEKTSPQISPLPSSIDEYFTEDSYKDLPVFPEQKPGPDDRKAQTPLSTVVGQRTLMSPKQNRSDSDMSEKLFSPCSTRHEILTPVPVKSERTTDGFSTDSEPSISEINQQDLNPVLTSTRRLPRFDEQENETSLPHQQNVYQNTEIPPNRMSPNTLERRLRAEINMFDSVGDSIQQLNEMERVRNLVQAQQETVSLAQVLKSRHLAHQNELAKMSADAKEKTAISAKEVEAARLATAEASANALKAIAEIKSKAAEEVMLSAKQLTEIQNQATSTTLEALNRVDKARQSSADAYEFSVRRQIADVEKVTTAAATAASTAAVETALRHHREQLEELRRRAFAKVSKTYTNVTQDVTRSNTASATSKFSSSTSSQIRTAESSYSDVFETNPQERTLSEEITEHSDSNKTPPTSPPQTKYYQNVQKSTTITKDEKSSVSESITLIKDGSDKEASIVEEVIPHDVEDKELSEALFSVKKYKEKTSSVSVNEEESIHSVHSEEKFHSSFTEEEFKNDFHMVLPSENHRRKSLDRKDYLHSGNDTSSDELITPRAVGKWNKKRSKSPFADEETFSRFTADMVRQYIQEEEVRAKHQAALLGLREKAIIEKTQAEMAYLEMQKKNLKTKGVHDERMPPIAKKQRALILKLQAEQTEIRRLKGAFKQASNERKAMLNHEKEIQRIRESTQKIWNKMEVLDKSNEGQKPGFDSTSKSTAFSDGKVEETNDGTEETPNKPSSHVLVTDEISEDIPPNAMSDSENLSESKSTNNIARTGDMNTVAKDKSSLSKDLKKLQYMTSKRYLTDREKKLQSRRQQFNEMMERKSMLKNWRQKIQDEEQKLKADIKRVLEKGGHEEKMASPKQDEATDVSLSKLSVKGKDEHTTLKSHAETDTSVGEELSSIADEYSSEKDSKNTTITESIGKPQHIAYRPKSSSSALSVKTSDVTQPHDKYSNEEFEEATVITSKSTVSAKPNVGKYRQDDESFTEGTSDASDIEQRLKGLENELYQRKTELHRLRRRKEREILKHKEQELRKELQAVEHLISCENKEQPSDSVSRVQQPRVLSPRSNLDSVILPEKIKIPTDSRKSLDFHDKETRKPSCSSEKDVPDAIATAENSIKEGISRTDVSTSNVKRKNITENTSTSSEFGSSSDVKPIGNEVVDSSDKSTSSVTIQLATEKPDTERSSIVEELSDNDVNTDGSEKEAVDIYADDFFESISSKKTTPSRVPDDRHVTYDDDFEETSGKYSSQYGSPVPSITKEIEDEIDFCITDNTASDKSSRVDSKISTSQSKINAILKKQTEDGVNIPLSSSSITQSSSVKHTDEEISDGMPVPLDEKNAAIPSTSSSSVIMQLDGFSKSNISSALGFRVNGRVFVEKTMPGTIRFLGKTPFSPVLVAGIELDRPMGTNNGSFQGKQYFTCAQDFGLFTTLERLDLLEVPDEQVGGLNEDASESSTVNDMDELQIMSDVPRYEEDFEEERSNKLAVDEKSASSTILKDGSFSPSDESLSHSTNINDLSKKEIILSDDRLAVDLDLKSHSSSEVESIDVEIPSPAKLDLSPLADSITNSIMKTLLAETASIPHKHLSSSNLEADGSYDYIEKLEDDSLSHKVDSIIATQTREPKVSQASVDGATDQLLKDAVYFMINIRKKKLVKQTLETSKLDENLPPLFITDNEAESPENEDVNHVLDADALTKRLNELDDVHDQLGLLLGESALDDDDDDDDESFDKTPIENLLLPPRGFGAKEPEFEIPYTEHETYAFICNAFNSILRSEASLDEEQQFLDKDLPLELSTGENTDKDLDKNSTKLYKKLIYDMTKSLLYDIKDFRDLQTTPRPLWMKMKKRTFSKFTRKTHTLTESELRHEIAQHVCSCLALRAGRPTLEQLRRKLPLNLAKKDYVDAVLVEELREEEAQWTDYDEDEVRVKFQLADALLDTLIQETVELLSSIY